MIRKDISDILFKHTRTIPFSSCIELDHNSYNGELDEKPWDWVEKVRMIINLWNVAQNEKTKK